MRSFFYLPVKPALLRVYEISGEIAATGHAAAQVPHDMHFAGSIAHLDASPMEIAITGHIPMHA
jgi:hypothetical protein